VKIEEDVFRATSSVTKSDVSNHNRKQSRGSYTQVMRKKRRAVISLLNIVPDMAYTIHHIYRYVQC
uniref:Uncharacterized protein n=1 Tax=Ciona intestinalis TaxID=7719 RepID=H2XPN5_CIOIN